MQMIINRTAILLMALVTMASCKNNIVPPEPFGACPTPQQVEWQKMEMNMFCHFGPNTFTGLEWGDGTEAESLFNPTALDCRQWAEVARQGGFGGVIITAKHHDGFCLWPTPYSNHTVSQSPWRDGKGDVLRELREACDDAGVKMGIYISPWDRNAPTYGTPEYNETFRLTLEDALSRYGDIFEQWFDGANGEGPSGKKQEYDWPLFNSTVARLQPNAVIFSDVGPGCRWVGNEEGAAGETCWSTLNIEGFTPGAGSPGIEALNHGNRGGERWVPAETDVSIRPGWFYHDKEEPKSLQELLRIYYNSVGRNSLLLLNIPPDQRGLIAAADSLRIVEFRRALDSIFANDLAKGAAASADHIRGVKNRRRSPTQLKANPRRGDFGPENVIDDDYDSYWSVDDSVLSPTLTLSFDEPTTFNRVMLQEYIPHGQRVAKFHVEYMNADGQWQKLAEGTTIGYKRILLTATVTATAIRISIDESMACPVINRLGIFMDCWGE